MSYESGAFKTPEKEPGILWPIACACLLEVCMYMCACENVCTCVGGTRGKAAAKKSLSSQLLTSAYNL